MIVSFISISLVFFKANKKMRQNLLNVIFFCSFPLTGNALLPISHRTLILLSPLWQWSSVSQPVCHDAQMCRQIFLGVPPSLKMSKKVSTNSYIFIILASLLHLGVPPNLLSKLVYRELKKVENHCSGEMHYNIRSYKSLAESMVHKLNSTWKRFKKAN